MHRLKGFVFELLEDLDCRSADGGWPAGAVSAACLAFFAAVLLALAVSSRGVSLVWNAVHVFEVNFRSCAPREVVVASNESSVESVCCRSFP